MRVLLLLVFLVSSWNAQEGGTDPVGPAKAATTVAMLAFESRLPGDPEFGADIAETIAALLADEPGISFVDRTSLSTALREHALGLSGTVDAATAAKVGNLVGAELLVSGKAFLLGKQAMISMKVVGTETGLMEAVMVEQAADADVAQLVKAAAAKLGETLRGKGARLLAHPAPAPVDPTIGLKERFAVRAPVTIAVAISESHLAAQRLPDPAVETEVKLIASACGVKIQDVPANVLAGWIRDHTKDVAAPWPAGYEGVDYVLVGEAFSEGGPVLGELRVCLARAEVNLIRRSDGAIVGVDRVSTRAVDVAEFSAGKKALEAAGRQLGHRCLERLATLLPVRVPAP